MKKTSVQMLLFLTIIASLLSCSSSDGGGTDDGGGPVTAYPTNLVATGTPVGVTTETPNGDGTGVVNFTATANNITGGYLFTMPGGEEIQSTNGTLQYQFREPGVNSYTVLVKAYGINNSTVTGSVVINVNYETHLLWSDEFNTGTEPSASNWNRETGAGGWGNNEVQYYTTSATNSYIEDGMLHIKLKKENFSGSQYTSARLNSAGKFEFTYGRVEVRAKLPTGGGTWPAIWMLGANYGSAGWPGCGEYDIMEQVGNDPGKVLGTLHHPGHFGANGSSGNTMVPDCSSEFHVYATDWSPTSLKFYVDDNLFFTFPNNPGIPFGHDFFLILNVAMGGNFGGTVDPNFVESAMDIDYVRVYQ
ncbi:glycoside hydrolase family 16 protein [Flavobacterium silvaticum]|uniref:Glycoside hydrolase family 16 protein n=1 Tax=Flavobacterium silvaticum TaxID=1852020 RepID=A0A972FKK9_9FLAO|nr:glycoside hydrolase family 16 protein [Flavobacterium silvaticum]NMH26950.1 glycoside hydrolase family 16 protein [Flavobacterium silvaticum]